MLTDTVISIHHWFVRVVFWHEILWVWHRRFWRRNVIDNRPWRLVLLFVWRRSVYILFLLNLCAIVSNAFALWNMRHTNWWFRLLGWSGWCVWRLLWHCWWRCLCRFLWFFWLRFSFDGRFLFASVFWTSGRGCSGGCCWSKWLPHVLRIVFYSRIYASMFWWLWQCPKENEQWQHCDHYHNDQQHGKVFLLPQHHLYQPTQVFFTALFFAVVADLCVTRSMLGKTAMDLVGKEFCSANHISLTRTFPAVTQSHSIIGRDGEGSEHGRFNWPA